MHLHLCCIIVLAFFTPSETRKTCNECSFPKQMRGVGLWLKHEPESEASLLIDRWLLHFEVDFPQNLFRLYRPPNSHSRGVEFIHDMEKDLMYRFTSSDDCKYVKIPPEFKFPSCVPSNLTEEIHTYEILYIDDTGDPYSPSRSEQYKLEKNDKCDLIFTADTEKWNSTLKVEWWYYIKGYKLPNGSLQLPVFLNTSVCTESNFDLFIRKHWK